MDTLVDEMRHLAGLVNITLSQNARLEHLMAEHSDRTSSRSARMANIRLQPTERHAGTDPVGGRRKSSSLASREVVEVAEGVHR